MSSRPAWSTQPAPGRLGRQHSGRLLAWHSQGPGLRQNKTETAKGKPSRHRQEAPASLEVQCEVLQEHLWLAAAQQSWRLLGSRLLAVCTGHFHRTLHLPLQRKQAPMPLLHQTGGAIVKEKAGKAEGRDEGRWGGNGGGLGYLEEVLVELRIQHGDF